MIDYKGIEMKIGILILVTMWSVSGVYAKSGSENFDDVAVTVFEAAESGQKFFLEHFDTDSSDRLEASLPERYQKFILKAEDFIITGCSLKKKFEDLEFDEWTWIVVITNRKMTSNIYIYAYGSDQDPRLIRRLE
jgi:hypothetical protein